MAWHLVDNIPRYSLRAAQQLQRTRPSSAPGGLECGPPLRLLLPGALHPEQSPGQGLLPASAAPVRFNVLFTPELLSHYLDSIIVNNSLYQTFPVQITVWLLSLNWTLLEDTYVQTEILEESIKEDKELLMQL